MQSVSGDGESIAQAARREFDLLTQALTIAGVEVLIDDEPDLPDSVFPNNWLSFHQPISGPPTVVTYPMATPLRRLERRQIVLDRVLQAAGEQLRVIGLEHLESSGHALEGTGSLVLDRVSGVAFACRSPRASDEGLDAWAQATGFEVVPFDAVDGNSKPVYHTNVLMSIGSELAVFVPGTIGNEQTRSVVLRKLATLEKRVIELSIVQMNEMCANLIELRSGDDQPVFAMSSRAFSALERDQRVVIEGLGEIVHVPIPTIEAVGGGSVRCMIAELGSPGL